MGTEWRQFGRRNASRDARKIHVLQRQNSVHTTSALDYWEQLTTLHYGGRAGICSHFHELTVAETGMAWAGAPFAVPALTLADSILTVTTAGRAFIYQLMAAANHYDKLASVALVSNTIGDYVGLRLDDGTDNNYLEVVLQVFQASPTQWQVWTYRRTGGGAVTNQAGNVMVTDPGFVLRMNLSFAGAAWANNWNAFPVLHTNMGFDGWLYNPQTFLGTRNLVFTPTRAGVVFYAGAPGETSLIAKADWFDIGRA